MDVAELTSDAFWRSKEIWVARPPDGDDALLGLCELAGRQLPEGGCLFSTSGTEGLAKWVALEKRAFLHSARVVNAHYGLGPRDRWLVVLPLHHVGGFSILARAWLAGSEVIHLSEKWCPLRFEKTLRVHKITSVSLVPTQIFDVVQAGLRCPDCVTLVLVGGAKLERDLEERAWQLGWPLRRTFGMTETASQVASEPHDRHADTPPEALEVLPHWEAKTDVDGRLILRGPALARGYLQGDEESGWSWLLIDQDKGLVTRDHVELWHLGTRTYLRHCGRVGGMLKILGELVALDALSDRLRRVAPEAVKSWFVKHADGFCLVPVEDDRRGYWLWMVVESGLSAVDLEDWLAAYHGESSGYEQLKGIREMKVLPRTELGKIRLGAVKAEMRHCCGDL